ncbi:Corrinoid adenosyltransferase [subsurface metagenome]
MEKGLVQIYTGNGKGKTTASLGLTLRACGHGFRVFIAQFAKGMSYGELTALKKFDSLVCIRQYGRTCFIYNKPEKEDIELAKVGWEDVKTAVSSREYDIIILDEIGIALYYKLISLDEVKNLIQNKPESLELVLTGRKMPEELFTLSDLVTEMCEIKHYYRKGVEARKGIEY